MFLDSVSDLPEDNEGPCYMRNRLHIRTRPRRKIGILTSQVERLDLARPDVHTAD